MYVCSSFKKKLISIQKEKAKIVIVKDIYKSRENSRRTKGH